MYLPSYFVVCHPIPTTICNYYLHNFLKYNFVVSMLRDFDKYQTNITVGDLSQRFSLSSQRSVLHSLVHLLATGRCFEHLQ